MKFYRKGGSRYHKEKLNGYLSGDGLTAATELCIFILEICEIIIYGDHFRLEFFGLLHR